MPQRGRERVRRPGWPSGVLGAEPEWASVYYFSRSQRVTFQILLFYWLADCGISETT
jgi:hypothetical protein